APQLRNEHARSRRGPAQRAGITRTRESFHYTNIRARHGRALEESLRRRTPASMTNRLRSSRGAQNREQRSTALHRWNESRESRFRMLLRDAEHLQHAKRSLHATWHRPAPRVRKHSPITVTI